MKMTMMRILMMLSSQLQLSAGPRRKFCLASKLVQKIQSSDCVLLIVCLISRLAATAQHCWNRVMMKGMRKPEMMRNRGSSAVAGVVIDEVEGARLHDELNAKRSACYEKRSDQSKLLVKLEN